MFRKRHIGALIGAIALVGLALAPVSASYPGTTNGRIAFGVRAGDGSANIFSAQPDGTGLRQLTTGPGNHLCPAYSADGREIAYCADASGSFEIWTMKQNGTKQHQVTHLGGFATFPDISPDGSKIAFGGTEGADPNNEIYVIDAATGDGLVALTSCASLAPGCSNDFPAWSPDGRLIAFIHTDDFDADENPVNEQVWVMNADGSNQHPLTTDSPPKDQVPDWSPDGSRIAYNSGFFGSGGIWVMNANGSGQHQLTGCGPADPSPCAAGDDFGTAWSPDGTKIAFLRDFHSVGINDRPIYVMDADGSDQQRLISGPILQAVPAWQARGTGGGD
jgi:Periplasmic component of the Tol biopolymer transport system